MCHLSAVDLPARAEVITVFTLCAANYLAHAKTLGESLAQHNPDYHFVIGLVDRLPPHITTIVLAAARVDCR